MKTSDIHENNTVEKLEKYVMLAPKIRTYKKRDVYPLTGSQKGIFAECMKNPESTVYNIPFLFELDKEKGFRWIGKCQINVEELLNVEKSTGKKDIAVAVSYTHLV